MNKINLLPMAGINNVGRDEALQVRGDAPRTYLREAVNVDISPNGKPRTRPTRSLCVTWPPNRCHTSTPTCWAAG